MKTMTLVAIALGVGLAMPLHAMESKEDAGAPKKIGAAITVKKAVDLAKLEKHPKRFVGQTVRLEGSIKEVCQGAGCWVRVTNAKGAAFLAKSLDESVLLPNDSAGRRIVVQGVVTEMAARDAEAHKAHDCAAEGHECPTPSYLVATQGIELFPTKN